MVASIIALAGTLLGFLVWYLKRRAVKADDPLQQNKKRYEQIDKDLVKRDSLAATAHATDDLDELERLQHGKGDQR